MRIGAARYMPFVILFVCFFLTGCFSPVRYGSKLEENPTTLHYADLEMGGEVLDRWWEVYGDAALNAFIETVLTENMSLQVAYLRMLDSHISYEQSMSGYYPTLSLSAGVGVGGNISSDSTVDPSYSLGLSLGYEIDIWGRIRAQAVVNEAAVYSARDAAESAAISLVGRVVTEWFNVLYYRERLSLTNRLLALSESYYTLVQDYYRSGQSTGMDVLEQNQQLETLRATIQSQETSIRLSERSLEILAGGRVRASVEGMLPAPADMGGTVDVETLMKRRPDIRAALRSAQQADAKIVIALADRLPSLRLSASLAFRASDITELFKRLIWDVAANFVVNLFDGFKATKAIDRAKVSFLQEKMSYGIVVMDAVAEVEKALLTLRLREQELLNAQAELARQTHILNVSREYYVGGLIEYNRVLSALRSLISTSQNELDARKNVLLAQLAVFQSMGGGAWLEDVSLKGEEKARQALSALDQEE